MNNDPKAFVDCRDNPINGVASVSRPQTGEQAVGNTLRAWITSSSHARVTSTKSRIFLADNTSSSHTQVGLCRYRSCLLEVTAGDTGHGKGRKTLDIFLVSI